MSFIFRSMVYEDLVQVTQLAAKVSRRPWGRLYWQEELEQHSFCMVVVNEQDEIIAFCVVRPLLDDEWHVLNLGVDQPYRRQGMARRLMQHMMTMAALQTKRMMLLEVGENNLSAISLYRSLGFLEIGRREAYYPAQPEYNGCDSLLAESALVMKWEASF